VAPGAQGYQGGLQADPTRHVTSSLESTKACHPDILLIIRTCPLIEEMEEMRQSNGLGLLIIMMSHSSIIIIIIIIIIVTEE